MKEELLYIAETDEEKRREGIVSCQLFLIVFFLFQLRSSIAGESPYKDDLLFNNAARMYVYVTCINILYVYSCMRL